MGDVTNLTQLDRVGDKTYFGNEGLCVPVMGEDETECLPIDDSFEPISNTCDYEAIVRGFTSSQFQICHLYPNWLLLIPSPFLANPLTRNTIDSFLNLANRLGVPEEDLIQVYQAAPPEYSVDDRLARVRTYLIFKEAQEFNARMSVPNLRGVVWKAPYISPDFDHFARAVMAALKKSGAVNVREVSELYDELGFPLSGLYQELDNRSVSLRVGEAQDFFGYRTKYVSLHELRHWDNIRQKRERSYEAEELEAAYLAMKALLVVQGGSEIQWEKGSVTEEAKGPKDKLEEINLAIRTLPKNMQIPFSVIWERVQEFVLKQRKTSYLTKVFKAAYFELTEGRPREDLLAQAHSLLESRKVATELVLDMERFLKRMKRNELALQECGVGLDYIVYLALQNQIPLALHELDSMMEHYQERGRDSEVIFGTP